MEGDGRGERVVENVRQRASAVAETMGHRVDELRGYAEDAETTVREYAREHPWAAVGIAAGVGFILGRLLSRA